MLLRKQAVKWYFIFPPHLTSAAALPGKQKAKNCIFLLKFWEFFASRHRKHIHVITWSQPNRPLFSQKSAVCTKQDQWSEYSMLSSVTTHSSFNKSVVMSIAVSSGSCSLSSLKWKVNGQYWWNILLSQQILAVIKRFVDNNITCLSATQLMHAPVHGVSNTVQQLLRKTISFVSPELWPQQARAELN